jgi:hypothetical protein
MTSSNSPGSRWSSFSSPEGRCAAIKCLCRAPVGPKRCARGAAGFEGRRSEEAPGAHCTRGVGGVRIRRSCCEVLQHPAGRAPRTDRIRRAASHHHAGRRGRSDRHHRHRREEPGQGGALALAQGPACPDARPVVRPLQGGHRRLRRGVCGTGCQFRPGYPARTRRERIARQCAVPASIEAGRTQARVRPGFRRCAQEPDGRARLLLLHAPGSRRQGPDVGRPAAARPERRHLYRDQHSSHVGGVMVRTSRNSRRSRQAPGISTRCRTRTASPGGSRCSRSTRAPITNPCRLR